MFFIPASRGVIFLLASLLALSPLGCGDGVPDNVPISGKVVYANGKPLTTGMIVFNPVAEGEEAPMAEIQQDGTFEFSEDGGIPPGEYRVALAPSEEEMAEAEEEPAAFSFPAPQKYLQADTSGWTASVKESDNEPFTFTIGKR
jgi:hypothetical protein